MQNVSSDFKTAIKAPSRELKIRGLIETPDNSVYPLSMTDLAQGGFSYKASCMENDFSLGGATAASCTLVLTNYDKQWDDVDLEGGKLTVYCGVVTGYEVPEPDEPEEEMPEPEPVPIIEDVLMGTFIIDRQSRPYATITLSAADRLILLDKPLVDVPGVIYPTDARTLLNAMSGACNVPLDNSLLNIDTLDEISMSKPDYDGYTCRDALGEIALLCGGFARMTREGALEIVKLEAPDELTAYPMAPTDRFSFRETTEPITLTGIMYQDTLIGDPGYVVSVDNLQMVSDTSALAFLQAVWDDLDGFTYTPCTADYTGNPAIDTGDAILHTTRDDKDVLTFVAKHTFTFGGRCSIDSYGKSASEQKYISANTRRLSGLVAGITHDFDKKLSSFEQASAQMSDLIGLMMGVYPTSDPQPDGSTIYYWHDQPTLEESLIIWRLDKNAFAVSSDGGTTWTGQTSDGTVIARTVHALDIRAERVIMEDDSDAETILTQLRAGEIRIEEHLSTGGVNLLENATYGGREAPDSSFWCAEETICYVLERLGNLEIDSASEVIGDLTITQVLEMGW